MTAETTISIVITCYSEGAALEEAVASAETQQDQNFELLVVNDASVDEETNRLCRQLEKEERARVVWRKSNGGLSAARNTGYEHMSGEICIPLDADDVLPDNCVGTVRNAFHADPSIGYLFGNYKKVIVETGEEQLVDCSELTTKNGFMAAEKCLSNWFLLGVSPCRKSTWEKVSGFDQEFSYGGQDVDFWMKVFKEFIPGRYVESCIYIWKKSAKGMNAKRKGIPLNKLDIIEKNLSTFDAYGLGTLARTRLMRGHLLFGRANRSKRYARQLLRDRCFGPTQVMVATLPFWISKKLFGLQRNRQPAR